MAARFAMTAASESGKEFRGLTPDAIRVLQARDWPGNVRELQHAVERAVILSPDPIVDASMFDSPSASGALPEQSSPTGAAAKADGQSVLLHSLDIDAAEQVLIARALEIAGGNRTKAAGLLGMSVRTLRSKLNSGE